VWADTILPIEPETAETLAHGGAARGRAQPGRCRPPCGTAP
jgi:hypothetical protein